VAVGHSINDDVQNLAITKTVAHECRVSAPPIKFGLPLTPKFKLEQARNLARAFAPPTKSTLNSPSGCLLVPGSSSKRRNEDAYEELPMSADASNSSANPFATKDFAKHPTKIQPTTENPFRQFTQPSSQTSAGLPFTG
jgi:hypothetical protein